MSVSSRYVLQQGPMLVTLGKTAAFAALQPLRAHKAKTPETPSAEVRRSFASPPPDLLDAYVRHVGGDPRSYRGIVPPHFFPHWAMPVAAQTLVGLPYPLLRIMNAGCRMQINAPLPRGERLHVRAHLAGIDDDGKRALITERVVTGTDTVPDALSTDIYAIVPLGRSNGKRNGAAPPAASNPAKEKPRVPDRAHEIGFTHLARDAGLSFAKLTGDFNPIHWSGAYAKASGFRGVILHGYATFARAYEAVQRGVLGGDTRRIRVFDAKFTRPLVLPHDIGFFVRDDQVFVGDAVRGPAYMTGHFETGGNA